MQKKTIGKCFGVFLLAVASIGAAKQIYGRGIALHNQKMCFQVANEIMSETGMAFPVGFDSNTVLVFGTVDDEKTRQHVASVVMKRIDEFQNENPIGHPPVLLNLIGLAGQPEPANPRRLGLPNENEEADWTTMAGNQN